MLLSKITPKINNENREKYNNPSFGAMPMTLKEANTIKSRLLNSAVKTADIFCHSSADEDAFACMKVMQNWLKKNGKKVSVCLKNNDVRGLFGASLFLFKSKTTKTPADESLILDFNGSERVPVNSKQLFNKISKSTIFGFDHHKKANTYIEAPGVYRDESAKSCSGVLYRFFEALGEDISRKDRINLFCGLVSDYQKSNLLVVQNSENGYEAVKTKELLKDKNSMEVFERLEKSLNEKDKEKVYRHLDDLAHLSSNEKLLRETLIKEMSLCPGGRLAYMYIPPEDKLWAKVGMDRKKTSSILKDIRTRLVGGIENDENFTLSQRKRFKDVKCAIAFYRVSPYSDSPYQMSITSKDGYAAKLIDYVRENYMPDLVAGGHEDRAGGRIDSLETDDVLHFVNNFIKADQALAAIERNSQCK